VFTARCDLNLYIPSFRLVLVFGLKRAWAGSIWLWTVSSGSWCEHCNEPLDFMTGGEFLEWLIERYVLQRALRVSCVESVSCWLSVFNDEWQCYGMRYSRWNVCDLVYVIITPGHVFVANYTSGPLCHLTRIVSLILIIILYMHYEIGIFSDTCALLTI
jgi:hypothetical protein